MCGETPSCDRCVQDFLGGRAVAFAARCTGSAMAMVVQSAAAREARQVVRVSHGFTPGGAVCLRVCGGMLRFGGAGTGGAGFRGLPRVVPRRANLTEDLQAAGTPIGFAAACLHCSTAAGGLALPKGWDTGGWWVGECGVWVGSVAAGGGG